MNSQSVTCLILNPSQRPNRVMTLKDRNDAISPAFQFMILAKVRPVLLKAHDAAERTKLTDLIKNLKLVFRAYCIS